eukprot:COSAG05_NODE_1747_length_4151_cov_4.600197_9_plen_39_part_01
MKDQTIYQEDVVGTCMYRSSLSLSLSLSLSILFSLSPFS